MRGLLNLYYKLLLSGKKLIMGMNSLVLLRP